MRTEKPLWERVYLGPWGTAYVNAGKVIGHLGGSALAFHDAAKLLPGFDKHRYECAVRDLTVYAKRERGEYELHATARKVLRVIIGPPPGDPPTASSKDDEGRAYDARKERIPSVGAKVIVILVPVLK